MRGRNHVKMKIKKLNPKLKTKTTNYPIIVASIEGDEKQK